MGAGSGEVLAELDQLLVDLAVVLKAEDNEDFALAGICGGDLVAFYFVDAGKIIADQLRIVLFAFFFSA